MHTNIIAITYLAEQQMNFYFSMMRCQSCRVTNSIRFNKNKQSKVRTMTNNENYTETRETRVGISRTSRLSQSSTWSVWLAGYQPNLPKW